MYYYLRHIEFRLRRITILCMHFFHTVDPLNIVFIGSKNSLLCLVKVLKQAKIPLLLGIALPNFGSKKLTAYM